MKQKVYKVSLRQVHVTEIIVDAVSKADAIGKAIDDGGYEDGIEYFEDMEDGHQAEEI